MTSLHTDHDIIWSLHNMYIYIMALHVYNIIWIPVACTAPLQIQNAIVKSLVCLSTVKAGCYTKPWWICLPAVNNLLAFHHCAKTLHAHPQLLCAW